MEYDVQMLVFSLVLRNEWAAFKNCIHKNYEVHE